MSPRVSPLESARKLARKGGEGRHYLASLLGASPEDAETWRGVEALCRRALAQGAGPEALSLRGRALAQLGDPAAALEALDRSLALDARSAEARAWRAEALLLSGRRDEALRELDAAVARRPSAPWPRLLRAVARLAGGDAAGARVDARAAGRSRAAREAATAVAALSEGQAGRPDRGARLLDAVVRGAKPPVGLLALRGVLRRDARDLEGGLADLNRAVERAPTPWTLCERADALNRAGFYKDALADVDRAAQALPSAPQPRAQAANILFDQAFYPEALAKLEEALALAPGDPGLLARRARFLLVLQRLPDAEADLRRVLELDPGNGQARFELLQNLILQNRFDEAVAALDAAGLDAPFDRFLRGYAACRSGRHAAARKLFLEAAASSEGPFAKRMRFFALVARVLGEGGSVSSEEGGVSPRFYLCGIGIHHPYQLSVDIVRALARCDVLYNNVGDPQISEFLGLFKGQVRAVTRVFNEPATGRVARVLAGAAQAATTGFVTRIHPFIYRRIANDLVRSCEERGITYRAFGAVSLTEVSWGLAAEAGGGGTARALRVFDLVWLVGRPELLPVDEPAVVYCIANGNDRAQFCAMIRAKYPARHRVFLLAGSGDREQEVAPVEVSALEPVLTAADMGAVLFVPPVERSKR